MKVLMEIEVPDGKYCYKWAIFGSGCKHLDTTGGHYVCEIGFHIPFTNVNKNEIGCLKPRECLNLKEV